MEEVTTYNDTKQRWTILRNSEDVDLDQIRLEIYHPITDEILVDVNWQAKDFFKKMVDLQYDYSR